MCAIREHLDKLKLSVKWKYLNADKKLNRVDISKMILKDFERSNKNFMKRIVIVYENGYITMII